MKVINEVILRKIAGEYVLIPVGKAAENLYGIISLTESGKILWQKLEQDCTEEELVEELLAQYEVDRETASTDVRNFLEKLKKENLLCIEQTRGDEY